MKKSQFYIILLIVIVSLSGIFAYKYVKNESPVYIFDYSGYHEIYKQYIQESMDSPRMFVKDVITSIRELDYNCSPIMLLFPFYIIFKGSRFGYILGLTLLYVVPTIMLAIIITKKMIFKEDITIKDKKNFIVFLCIIAFLYTRWWSSTLRGLPDIISIIPLGIATLLWMKHSFLDKQKIYIPILIGFLVYLCFMFRRYFMYEIIGFYVSLFVVELIKFIKIKDEKKNIFINATKNFLIAGITTLSCLLIIQLPLVKTILIANYSSSYSAFQVSLKSHITNAINEFGYIILIFAIIGAIYTIKSKEHRSYGILCICNIIVCYGSFMTVQAMGVHHYLTISLWIFILFVYGIYAIWCLIKNNLLKNLWLVLIVAIMVLNFSSTYIFRELRIPFLTQNNKYNKLYYENFDEIERLIVDIDKLVGGDENVKFSVLASTEILSDNLMDLLGTNNMKKSIVYTSAIDLRDGINFNSLASEYIVVTDIAQINISETGQRIVSVPNDAIYNQTSIGKAYTRISGPYNIQGGVKAFIYKKDRAFKEEEVNEYMNILKEYHSEWKEMYNKFDDAILMSERTLGEGIGDVKRYDYDTLYFSPGMTPTIYDIKVNKNIESLDLKLYIDGKVDTSVEGAGNVKLTIKGDDNVLYDDEIIYGNDKKVQLDLTEINKLTFIADKNVNLSYDFLYIDIENVVIK